tara:strand:- start:2071 stop:3576 length:1506 start_codon:yes stop_codon:yes gene_type:complete
MIRFDNLTFFDGDKFTESKTVVIDDAEFKWIGDEIELPVHYSNVELSINSEGLIAIPGFVDSHIHFLGLSARLVGHQLSFEEHQRLPDFLNELKRINQTDKTSECLRIYGLDLFHPSANILFSKDIVDLCIPNRPAVIRFTSGHGVLLNSYAMDLLGITESTDEIEGSTFARSTETGNLTGVFYEIETLLKKSMPVIPKETIFEGIKRANHQLLSNGFTSFMDATAENDLSRLNFLADSIEQGYIDLNVSFMLGYEYLQEFTEANIKYGMNFRGISIGPVKLLTSFSGGSMYPEDLEDRILKCHKLGFPVAIHAVEEKIVHIASQILSNNHMKGDRIEHATELNDESLSILENNKIYLSVNPNFVYEYGDRYMRMLSSDEINKVYRFRSMIEKNLIVGFGSDAPVSMPSALRFIKSATKRITKNYKVMSLSEKITINEAINMATYNNRLINNTDLHSGKISVGYIADMVLVKRDDLFSDKDYVPDTILLNMKQGQILYSNL